MFIVAELLLRTMLGNEAASGSHCSFASSRRAHKCPGKILTSQAPTVCPLLDGLMT
jgi:hypothetical protein